jgi:hypothetical protein
MQQLIGKYRRRNVRLHKNGSDLEDIICSLQKKMESSTPEKKRAEREW